MVDSSISSVDSSISSVTSGVGCLVEGCSVGVFFKGGGTSVTEEVVGAMDDSVISVTVVDCSVGFSEGGKVDCVEDNCTLGSVTLVCAAEVECSVGFSKGGTFEDSVGDDFVVPSSPAEAADSVVGP